jgi:hypothetical protein
MMDMDRKREMFARASLKAKHEDMPNVARGYSRACMRIDAVRRDGLCGYCGGKGCVACDARHLSGSCPGCGSARVLFDFVGRWRCMDCTAVS